ncbi:MAG: hypothetical protein FJY10_09060 [Bacteroidetes bacterium]|nr:hypothetical protein [Bacteroidota bacterium]
MKNLKKFIGAFLLFLPLIIKAKVKEIPFTLDDRNRIIRTEQKVEAMEIKIDEKVDGLRNEMNARFDQLFNFLWAIIGIFTAMMVSVFGFAFWDRKLSIAPVKRDQARIIESLRELAEHQPKLREILKKAGLL